MSSVDPLLLVTAPLYELCLSPNVHPLHSLTSGALVLIEFTLMAFVFYFAFGGKITMPNTPYATYMKARGPEGSGRTDSPTMWWFLMQVLSFRDVFGLIAPEDEQQILNGSSNKGEDEV